MRLHILDCDRVDPDLLPIGGQYSDMFVRAFSQARPDWDFEIHATIDGVLPEIESGAAYLITGSRADSFADDDWIVALRQWIVQAHQAQTPCVGICFGHQIIAHALGGKAERAAAGWGVGRMPAQAHGLPFASADILVSHRDQVTQLPPGAEHLMGSNFCPNFSFRLGRMIGVQGHPEFTPEYSAALARARRDRIGSDRVDQALASLSAPLNADQVIEWLACELENL